MAKHWMKEAFSGSHGQFKAKAERAGKTTREFAAEHADDKGLLGKQARLAQAGMAAHHAEGGVVSKVERLYGKKKVAHKGFAEGGKVNPNDWTLAKREAWEKESKEFREQTEPQLEQERDALIQGGKAKGGEVKSVAKHKFKKGHRMPPRGAPMRAEEAANTAGDPPQGGPPPTPMTTAPEGMPAQATGGSVSKVAPMSRSQKMYSPKRLARSA